jgi:hypothetical protein
MQGEIEAHVAGFVQVMDTPALVAIVQGKVSAHDIVRAELASRGLDMGGRWVGFRAAAQLAANDSTAQRMPDVIAERLVCALGFSRLQPVHSTADFRELSVWRIHESLEEAYLCGANRARK